MIEEQPKQPVAGGLDAKIAELKCELAYVRLQRDALLDMTWLDLPAEPSESTAEWRRLFAEGWVRRAAADDSAQPLLENETRVRLQRAGSPALTWTREKPKRPGWWWVRQAPGLMPVILSIEIWHGELQCMHGGVWRDMADSKYWHGLEWSGPLTEPLDAPETPTPENQPYRRPRK